GMSRKKEDHGPVPLQRQLDKNAAKPKRDRKLIVSGKHVRCHDGNEDRAYGRSQGYEQIERGQVGGMRFQVCKFPVAYHAASEQAAAEKRNEYVGRKISSAGS